jgi:hypothetical protein
MPQRNSVLFNVFPKVDFKKINGKYYKQIMIEIRRGKWEIKPDWTQPASFEIFRKKKFGNSKILYICY